MLDIEKFIDGLHDYLGKAFAPVRDRLKAAEDRLEKLEAASAGFAYQGTWASEKEYHPGQFVTFAGSLWHSNVASIGERPGQGPAWTMTVKSGEKR